MGNLYGWREDVMNKKVNIFIPNIIIFLVYFILSFKIKWMMK